VDTTQLLTQLCGKRSAKESAALFLNDASSGISGLMAYLAARLHTWCCSNLQAEVRNLRGAV
jgi:hypothetical protein